MGAGKAEGKLEERKEMIAMILTGDVYVPTNVVAGDIDKEMETTNI